MKRNERFVVKTSKHWEAMGTAVRLEIVDFMEAIAPCSIAQLARQMNRSANGLYHHINVLVEAGLLCEAGSRHTGTRNEALYDIVADRIECDFASKEEGLLPHRLGMIGSVLRFAERLATKALRRGRVLIENGKRNFWSRLDTAKLTEAEIDQVNQHVRAIQQIFADARCNEKGELYTFLSFMTPNIPSEKAPNRRSRVESEPESTAV